MHITIPALTCLILINLNIVAIHVPVHISKKSQIISLNLHLYFLVSYPDSVYPEVLDPVTGAVINETAYAYTAIIAS